MEKNDPDNGLPEKWKEYAAVTFMIWVGLLILAHHLVRYESSGKWGQLGDIFGALNSLVSILGFGAVIYSLQRQHKDSKEADKRHSENQSILINQIALDAKLRLFDRRFAVHENLKAFIRKGVLNKLEPSNIPEIERASAQLDQLCPNNPKLTEFLKQLESQALKLVSLDRKLNNKDHGGFIQDYTCDDPGAMQVLMEWFFKDAEKQLLQLFHQYLVFDDAVDTKEIEII